MEMTNDTNDNYIKQHHTTSNPDIQSHPHLYLSKTNFQHSPNPITTILVPINKNGVNHTVHAILIYSQNYLTSSKTTLTDYQCVSTGCCTHVAKTEITIDNQHVTKSQRKYEFLPKQPKEKA